MNKITKELIRSATVEYQFQMALNPEKLVELTARRCIQVALAADDPFTAVDIADLFGIKGVI